MRTSSVEELQPDFMEDLNQKMVPHEEFEDAVAINQWNTFYDDFTKRGILERPERLKSQAYSILLANTYHLIQEAMLHDDESMRDGVKPQTRRRRNSTTAKLEHLSQNFNLVQQMLDKKVDEGKKEDEDAD